MQGYRGNNRPGRWVTYLMGVWLTCLAGPLHAQRAMNEVLTWYVPQISASSPYTAGSTVVEYSSLTDLAEKLTNQAGKPYHLSLILNQSRPVDWQTLRTIPAANSLSIQLADSVMSDSLLPILATWPSLNKLEIIALSVPRSYTLMTSAKGETVFGTGGTPRRLAKTGWDKLKSLEDVTLLDEIDLAQAITALQALPALASLTIRQFVFAKTQDVPAALAGLQRLRKLSIAGRTMSRNYAAVFKEMSRLTDLTLTDPDMGELNAGLPYLTGLERLRITTFGQAGMVDKLRFGGLMNLQELHILSRRQTSISLDSTLAGLTGLKRLSIEQMKLATFPATLLANKGLTHLSMPDADLTALPNNLDQLAALEELVLDNNPIHHLPDVICKLSRLRHLSVSRCELTSLPAAIGQLTSLTSLVLTANQLTDLPASVNQLKQLRQLNVAMNQLSALPAELGTLPYLETIAAFWNKITRFPVSLTQVRYLYLSDNQLSELPASLGTSKRLRTLLIDNNLITSLPETIGQLDSLETLIIGGNRLTKLPAAIGLLRRLVRLDIGANQVRSLPESISGLTSLTSLSVKDNPIDRLPESVGAWQKLTMITIRLPQLESLPQQIGRWSALEMLAVDCDRMLTLPNELTDCLQLVDLSISGKRFIGLPESIGRLTRLSALSVDGRADSLTRQGLGQLIALPASLASCHKLTRLTVLNQQQFDGVEGMQVVARSPYLKQLAFINCGIIDLAGIPWKNLLISTLNLSQNRFSQLPAAILEMPNLEQANFSETNLAAPLNRFFLRRTELAEALKKE